ncbi:hypothetical protein C8F04DRAFT_1249666 [Mycena alexandri]|uniref:F-box domain-containing protein n=1 Tax=Mycena alexandri TaxID=1745969 RepID=A0AAD6TH53_9AGAR|nr:hypothetical protein C8F04DRAFT_1249666 [Mycena alexandri]
MATLAIEIPERSHTPPRSRNSVPIPYDVLHLIFSFALLHSTHDRGTFTRRHYLRKVVAAVCRDWRACALSTPSFWNTLLIKSSFDIPDVLNCVALSAKLPLTIHIELQVTPYDALDRLFIALAPAFIRCVSIGFTFSTYSFMDTVFSLVQSRHFPVLEDIFLRSNIGFTDVRVFPYEVFAPTIRSLYLQKCPVLWDPRVTFSTLHTLALSGVSMYFGRPSADFAVLCECAPLLARLFLDFVDCRCTETAGLDQPFHPMVHLHTLYVSFVAEDSATTRMLSCMRLPALSTVYFDGQPAHFQQLAAAAPTYFATVQLLHLQVRNASRPAQYIFPPLPGVGSH